MTLPRQVSLTSKLYAYVLENSLRENEVQRRLREETRRLPHAPPLPVMTLRAAV